MRNVLLSPGHRRRADGRRGDGWLVGLTDGAAPLSDHDMLMAPPSL